MSIADARRAARTTRVKIDGGVDPNAEEREAARSAAAAARNNKTLGEVLDLYDGLVLVQHRRGAGTRRALDGRKGLLRSLTDRVPSSITPAEISPLSKASSDPGRSPPDLPPGPSIGLASRLAASEGLRITERHRFSKLPPGAPKVPVEAAHLSCAFDRPRRSSNPCFAK